MGVLKKPLTFKPEYMTLPDMGNRPIYINPLSVTAVSTDGKEVTQIMAEGVKADGGSNM